MRQATDTESRSSSKKTPWIVLALFAATIFLFCGVFFLYHYENAYDQYSGAGFFSPSASVFIYHFLFSLFFLFAAICLKIILRKRVYLWTLLLTALLLPALCYQSNYHLLKKDALLSPLVEEGGIFHFLAIRDFNFDGMNDEEHHRLYEERSYSTQYSDYPNEIIQYVRTTAVGIGPRLDGCFCFYDEEKGTIDLHLNQDDVKLKEIELIVAFRDPSMAEKVSFYEIREETYVRHPHTINEEGEAVLRFSAETCLAWQTESENEYIKIPFQYWEDP